MVVLVRRPVRLQRQVKLLLAGGAADGLGADGEVRPATAGGDELVPVGLDRLDQISIQVLQVSLRRHIEVAACGRKPFPLDAATGNMALQVLPRRLQQLDYSMPLLGKYSVLTHNENVNVVAADEVFDERLFGRKARSNVGN